MRITFLHFSIFFILIMSLCACDMTTYEPVKKGVLDLSQKTLPNDFTISLSGEWEFYWNKLYKPEDFNAPNFDQKINKKYITVPGSWTSQKDEKGINYPNSGFATYHLTVILPKNITEVDVLHPPIWFAERSWVNGKLLPRPDKFLIKDSLRQSMYHAIETVKTLDQRLDFTIQVANQNFFLAGLIQNFQISAKHELTKQKDLGNARHLMWLGVLYALGIYHLVLYFFRRKNKSTLFFGVICFLVGIRLSIFGNHYVYEYLRIHADFFSGVIQVKIYYTTNALLVAFGLLYVHQLYPQESNHQIKRFISSFLVKKGLKKTTQTDSDPLKIVHLAVILLFSSSLLLSVIPIRYFPFIFIPIQIVVFGFAGYLIFVLVMSVIRKRQESIFQFVGVLTMLFAGINDAMHTLDIALTPEQELIPFAFGVFISLQFIVIAKRFSRAFSDVEDLSSNLEQKVIQRTTQITEQNIQLEKNNKHITDSVRYARRIQHAILGNENLVSAQFEEAFVMLLPKDIVSGDFYFYAQKEHLQILIAADCTGHGVPGAFMTIMGYNFLEEIITHGGITDPAQILHELDRKVISSLQKNQENKANDGMDISVLAINKSEQTVQYAGAKNPVYRVCLGYKMHQYKASKFPIGGSHRLQKNKTFETITINYQPGEVFYIFSDGYQDQFGGENGRKYMKKNFREFLLKISPLPMKAQKEKLRQEIQNWQGNQTQTDDILVIGIRL